MDRDEAYLTLTELISKGFLTTEIDLSGKIFVFKTATEKEFEYARMLSGHPDRKDYNSRFNVYFMCLSLLAVDGYNVLAHRNEDMSVLLGFFKSLPDKIFSNLFEGITDIRNVSYEVIKFLEGYCYTNKSRKLWKTLAGKFPNSDEVTGVPGTSLMGLNIHQEIWLSINRMLDDEEEYNKQFSLALLVASATNPKGTRRIRGQHDTNVKNMEDKRSELALKGFIDVAQWSPKGWAAPTDTLEGLVAELERQMEGKKDRHDLFIEGYMKSMREKAEKREEAVRERIKKAREQGDQRLLTSSQRPLTKEETEELMRKRGRTVISARGEDQASSEDKDRFIRKVSNKVLTSRRNN